jgi:hypothetical protein
MLAGDGAEVTGLVSSAGSEPWRAPIPLDGFALPPFPLTIFPRWLREYIEAVAEDTQTPADLAAMLALAVLATCCAKRVVLEVRANWVEPLSLWVVVGLGSGSRKTPVLTRLTEPLVRYERDWLESSRPSLAVAQSERRTLEARLRRLESDLGKGEVVPDLELHAERKRAAEELARTPVPVQPRLLVEDITTETLTSRLAEQGGRVALFSDEGGPFDIMAGRYSKNRLPNLDAFLKADSGSDIRVDRQGRASEYVQRPALTMGLAVQPDVIRGLGTLPGFAGRGLLSRPLFSMPTDTVGTRKIESIPVSREREAGYAAAILRLLSGAEYAQRQDFSPRTIRLEKSALRALNDLGRRLEPRLAAHGDLGVLTGWGSKLAGKVARVAALLHLADCGEIGDATPGEVSLFTVDRAVRLADYFIEHAKAAFGEMGADPVKREARVVRDWIVAEKAGSFTKRQAFNALRGRFERADLLDAPLRLLEEMEHVRLKPSEPRAGAGRPPSPVYEVNPELVSQNPHNRHKPSFERRKRTTRSARALRTSSHVYVGHAARAYRLRAALPSDRRTQREDGLLRA